jgi:hypothetical protein
MADNERPKPDTESKLPEAAEEQEKDTEAQDGQSDSGAQPDPEESDPENDASGDDQVEELSDEELDQQELEELRASEETYQWQASEYVHHVKGPIWYVALAVVTLVLMGGAILAHYWLAVGAFLVAGVAMGVYAGKPPRTLTYELTKDGIEIEGKAYPYDLFRSYGVVKEPEWHTIDLEPTKRFSPRLEVLFRVEDLDVVTDHLNLHLPRTDRDPDFIEQLTKYIRF